MTATHTTSTHINALDLCNCCDTEQAADNPAGYCTTCLDNARNRRECDHL